MIKRIWIFFIHSLLGWVNRIRPKFFTQKQKGELIASHVWDIVKASMECANENKFFKPVINNPKTIMYVSAIDPNGSYEADDILWVNPSAKIAFGNDIIGKKCYTVFQQKATVCEFCSNPKLELAPNEPYEWLFINPVTNRLYFITDTMVMLEGKRVRVEFAYDITDLGDSIFSIYRHLNHE